MYKLLLATLIGISSLSFAAAPPPCSRKLSSLYPIKHKQGHRGHRGKRGKQGHKGDKGETGPTGSNGTPGQSIDSFFSASQRQTTVVVLGQFIPFENVHAQQNFSIDANGVITSTGGPGIYEITYSAVWVETGSDPDDPKLFLNLLVNGVTEPSGRIVSYGPPPNAVEYNTVSTIIPVTTATTTFSVQALTEMNNSLQLGYSSDPNSAGAVIKIKKIA